MVIGVEAYCQYREMSQKGAFSAVLQLPKTIFSVSYKTLSKSNRKVVQDCLLVFDTINQVAEA